MATTGISFRATEQVAYLIRDCLGKQYPNRNFSIEILPSHGESSTHYCEVHIDGPECPEEIRTFLVDYLARLFPEKMRNLSTNRNAA